MKSAGYFLSVYIYQIHSLDYFFNSYELWFNDQDDLYFSFQHCSCYNADSLGVLMDQRGDLPYCLRIFYDDFSRTLAAINCSDAVTMWVKDFLLVLSDLTFLECEPEFATLYKSTPIIFSRQISDHCVSQCPDTCYTMSYPTHLSTSSFPPDPLSIHLYNSLIDGRPYAER